VGAAEKGRSGSMGLGDRRRLSPESLGGHVDRLYRAAWAMSGRREDAEDLVQETFARVLARPRFVRAGTEEGYLLRALRNTYFDSRRSAARRPSTEELPDEHRLVDRRQPDPADEVARHDALFGAIAALSDEYRDALVAVDIVGLSYREAAKALKLREETLATRLFRGRQQVARNMTDDPVTPSPSRHREPDHVQA
jgi:RNA polymerase sigma-70 factor (ECF subfamily)